MADMLNRLATSLSDRYAIERELGAGGMATVYLAQDLRHARKVAVKVLRPELSAILGGERFLNEIRVTANLQHPHILGLYDSGEADGLLYYVMPFVQGESLRQKLAREKQLGVDEAIDITRSVAAALDYAHRHGVIHRDIKPENILLADGQPLVADFGISLAVSNAGGNRLTETGLSLGTPNYMSPEQATGDRAVDGRSDLYSLACVAYEMLTGDPPHTGSTAQAVIAKIITEQPSIMTAARPATPPHVVAAIHQALAKLPADRFHTAAEFAEALGRPGSAGTAATTAAAAVTRRGVSWLRHVDWRVAVAVGIVGLGAGLAGRMLAPPPPQGQLARFAIAVEPYTTLGSGFAPGVALSRDGSLLAFVGRGPRGNQIFLRAVADSIPRAVQGTDGAFAPLFSPDGREIAFWTAAQRWARVPIAGGTAVEVATGAGNVAVWTERGFVYSDSRGRELWFAERGGAARQVVRIDTASFIALSPLPGGRRVLATLLSGSRNRTTVVAVGLGDGRLRSIGLDDVLKARYVPSGHVVFQRRVGGALLAAGFDPGALAVRGEERPIGPPARITFRVIPQWDAADDGSLAYIPVAPFELALVDRSGAPTVIATEPRSYHHPRLSPDGRRIALDITDSDARDIWMVDLGDRTLTRFTVGEIANDPYWSPDGRRVAYTSQSGSFRGVFARAADGSGERDSLLVDDNDHSSGSWSPDGRTLVVSTGLVAGLWIVPAAPDSARAAPVRGSRPSEAFPAFSPDGRWLAYVSEESGRQEVYVRPFPGPGGRLQVSAVGGTEPVWSRAGELLYREDGGTGSRLIAARVRLAPTFAVLRRTPLFDVSHYVPAEDHANYDVSPDGRRFVMVKSSQASQIQLVQHWQAQLRDR